jgi:hypothetical protein
MEPAVAGDAAERDNFVISKGPFRKWSPAPGDPITVQGTLKTELATVLGQGGALIKVRTKNGGVAIGKR